MYNLMEGNFDGYELSHIAAQATKKPTHWTTLGPLVRSRAPIPPRVFLEKISERSVKIKHTVSPLE
jgi:hypothetical protein